MDWGKRGSKGLLRAGEPARARVLSLMEHGAAEIESLSTNMGEERGRTRLAQEQTQADTLKLKVGGSCSTKVSLGLAVPREYRRQKNILRMLFSTAQGVFLQQSAHTESLSMGCPGLRLSGAIFCLSQKLFYLTLSQDCI